MMGKAVFALSIALILILAGCASFEQNVPPAPSPHNNASAPIPPKKTGEQILNSTIAPPPHAGGNGTALPPLAVCGNGIVEAGEACDGNGTCPSGGACGNDCICAPAPMPKCNFSIAGFNGNAAEYGTAEPINLTVAGVNEDRTPLAQKDGYAVVAYIYDVPPTRAVAALDGEYVGSGAWQLKPNALLAPGRYSWRILLMCAKQNSPCDIACGAGRQVEQTLQFTVKQTCTDSDGYDIYTKGTTLGISQNGTIVSQADSCSGSVLSEYVCNGKWAKLETTACDYGCQDGACQKSNAPLKVTTTWLPNAQVGKDYSAFFYARGGLQPRTNWRVSGGRLPVGLALNPDTGEIKGVPLFAETEDFTVSVEDANGTVASGSARLEVTAQ
ncbi:Uncharacterised protein [uncultured archaeon]|nr:Uncharacterised protein [uncultured archaeon]